ncbi:MAG: hypothetical protein UW73_C0009G0056 [Microgenomates group bacterium GW2011_GWB1_44_8]|nr:MAG: hypothetical protein UW73_C0009G0056 [Microgenomates group bacterium GW2011_GWB1_44_8]
MYVRHLDEALVDHLEKRKEALVLLGARQVGKTTILKKISPDALYLSVDSEPVAQALEKYDPAVYRQLLRLQEKVVVVDEIHRITDPGRAAKIFFDHIPEVRLIVTGSSSFRIKNKTSESLAGRKVEYYLYPLTLSEYLNQKGIKNDLAFPVLDQLEHISTLPTEKAYTFDLQAVLGSLLIYGLYPFLVSQPNDDVYLKNLVDSAVFKDLLDLSLIENRQAARNLLRLLAFQIGSLVNYSELATKLNIEVKTVRRYISLFEQSFIIFTISPFSLRARGEIGKMPKIYFYDVGLRNALIDNFQPLEMRPDGGALWENFVMSEIVKANYYGSFGYQIHFWRTKQGSEIDVVLEREGKIIGLEIKSDSGRANKAFKNRYPEANVSVITKKNLY